MRNSVVRVAVAGTCGLALALSACSSSGNDNDRRSSSSPPPSSSSPATSKAAARPTITQHPVPTAPANNVSKRKSVSLTKCASVSGGWSATGTAKNTSSKPVSYAITVFFTTNGATVLDYARTTVKVDPGKSASWTAQKKFAATKPTLCVLTGVA